MKKTFTILLIFALASTLLYTSAANGETPAPDKTLAVYVGTHPDDIDIAISGTLYKNDLGKHPILWVVVTDGGADIDEYVYETNSTRNWFEADGKYVTAWRAPDGSNVVRAFYSANMAKSRCGGYFDGLNWVEAPASHNSTYGVEYDWRTRVSNLLGLTVTKIQLSYVNPNDTTKRLTYPDGALSSAETAYTNSIAESLSSVIAQLVEANGYQKNLTKIYSHAPEEVCTNANEHSDHKVTGNAVRQAINLLHENYNFTQIDAKWFTIYTPINPKTDYTRTDEDISAQAAQKIALAKASWDTETTSTRAINFTWTYFPEDPGQYEYTIAKTYSAGPAAISLEGAIAFLKDLVYKYPLAVLAVVAVIILIIIAAAARKRKK